MNLVIDIGNSSSKAAFFVKGELLVSHRMADSELGSLNDLIVSYAPAKAIVSAVRSIPEELQRILNNRIGSFHRLTHNSLFPFKIDYRTPETLGPDRLAGIAGAYALYGESTVLVIDAGTAITYDLLEQNIYRGGNISPGISMRFMALNKFTGSLPLLEPSEEFESPGTSTRDAITAGVIKGVVYEINEYIRTFEKNQSNLKVIITGGDCRFIEKQIPGKLIVRPELVTEGLNYILDYNV